MINSLKGSKNYKNIVIGNARLIKPDLFNVIKYKIKDSKKEIDKLLLVINNLKIEFKELKLKESSEIIDFYIMYLEDEFYIEEIIGKIKKEKINADFVVHEKNQQMINFFSNLEDSIMRDKKDDIKFLNKKILEQLNKNTNKENLSFNDIIFIKSIFPLDLLKYYNQGIKAIITEEGSFTSHSSVIANSIDISYITGVKNCLNMVKDNDIVIVDGIKGEIYINPDIDLLSQYKKKKKERENLLKKLEKNALNKAHTTDNKYIKIMSNIDIVNLPKKIKQYSFEGIGLVRSEFIFYNINKIPDYKEQLTAYKELLLNNRNQEVTIRIFDFTEDKTPNTLKIKQNNPALGLRGIRFSFKQDIFKTQFKALIQASEFGNLKILFPMITGYHEITEIKKIEKEILKELDNEKNFEFSKQIKYKLGVMIETIASSYILEDIYTEIDFVSLGANDLMQYFFAADRDNVLVSDLSSPFEPSFIRFLKFISLSVSKYNLELSICGQIASTPSIIPVLIGLNFDILSVDIWLIPVIKDVISKISYKDSSLLVENLIKNKNSEENKKVVSEFLKEYNVLY